MKPILERSPANSSSCLMASRARARISDCGRTTAGEFTGCAGHLQLTKTSRTQKHAASLLQRCPLHHPTGKCSGGSWDWPVPSSQPQPRVPGAAQASSNEGRLGQKAAGTQSERMARFKVFLDQHPRISRSSRRTESWSASSRANSLDAPFATSTKSSAAVWPIPHWFGARWPGLLTSSMVSFLVAPGEHSLWTSVPLNCASTAAPSLSTIQCLQARCWL